MARDGPLTAGLQLRDPQLAGALRKPGQQLWRETQSRLSYAVAYSPAGPAIGGLHSPPCSMHGSSHPLSQVCRHHGLLPFPGERVQLSMGTQDTMGRRVSSLAQSPHVGVTRL